MAVGAGFRVLLAQRRREWSTGGMTHDLVIRAGTVIDGTGTTERVADVGISGDRIAEIAEPATLRGLRTIDADGLVVTPGFVDIHTHYDAQIGWDPLVSSSCWHGVTSIVMGNCGMTFAPCRPDDRAYLADCMESVEDIPARSILDGLAWDWQTYGEYLGSLDRHDKGINVGGMVGHSALRFWAMGDRSLDGDETPTDDELAEMAGLHRLFDEAGHLGQLVIGRGLVPVERTVAHRPESQRGVTDHPADVDALVVAVQGPQVLAVGLPVPREAVQDRAGGDVLDRLHAVGEVGAVIGPTRRERHAAVAHHDRRDAVPTRGRDEGVPSDLRVVVGMDVDEPGRDDETVGINRSEPSQRRGLGDLGDPIAGDPDVCDSLRCSGAVDDRAGANDEIVGHPTSRPLAPALRQQHAESGTHGHCRRPGAPVLAEDDQIVAVDDLVWGVVGKIRRAAPGRGPQCRRPVPHQSLRERLAIGADHLDRVVCVELPRDVGDACR